MKEQLVNVTHEDLVSDMAAWSAELSHAKRLGDRRLQLQLLRIRADADGHRWDVPKGLEPLSWYGVELDWNARTAILFSSDCAERVLYLFEALCPNDMRPREAIAAARRHSHGAATTSEMKTATVAARAAVFSVREAASFAMTSSRATVAAAWSEEAAAERSWQRDRLAQYLLGEVVYEEES